MAEFGWPPAPPEVQPACCLDLRLQRVVDRELVDEDPMPVLRQLLYGRWYPCDEGFAYAHPVVFTANSPAIEHLVDGRWVGGARVERCWLEWPDGRQLTIPIGDSPLYISGPAATFSAFPIKISVDAFETT